MRVHKMVAPSWIVALVISMLAVLVLNLRLSDGFATPAFRNAAGSAVVSSPAAAQSRTGRPNGAPPAVVVPRPKAPSAGASRGPTTPGSSSCLFNPNVPGTAGIRGGCPAN